MLFQNSTLRTILLCGYRAYAMPIFFLPGPRILVNSIPKAGTHLLMAFLCELPQVMLSGIHIKTWKVNHNARSPLDNETFRLDSMAFRKYLARSRSGQIITAHLPWNNELENILAGQKVRSIFLIRDPRDMIVSQFHYIKALRRHYLHEFFTHDIESDDQRLMALIKGYSGTYLEKKYNIKSIGKILKSYSNWATCPHVLTTQFEKIIGDRGGGDSGLQQKEFQRIATHIERHLDSHQLSKVIQRLSRKSSFTFRRGIIGDWKNHFSDEHKDAFKSQAGNYLIDWGYETDWSW